MKKLIMFLMALAISAPALALIDDVAPPAWGDGNPIATAVWQLDEDVDYSYEEGVEPSCLQGTVDSHLMTFEEDWSWEDGILYCEGSGLSAVVGVPEEGAGSYITCQVTVRFLNGVYDIDEPGIEIWHEIRESDEFEWLGEAFADMVDIGDGYYTQTATFGYSEDITHIGAVYRGTYGMMGIIIDAVIHEEGDPPEGAPRPGCIEKAPPIAVDSNDMPIYEPYDTGGPPPMGPTEGQLLVSLAWQPGEGLGSGGGYAESFTAMVVLDPNDDGEWLHNAHEDFVFPAGEPEPSSGSDRSSGHVILTFTEADWNIPQPVIVEAVEDLDREGDESYPIEITVTIDIADPNFGNPIPVIVKSSVVVIDNDIPYISVLPPGYLEDILTENSPGVPRCVEVTLSHEPTSNVEVRAFIESDYDLLADSMVVMDPSFEDSADPNHFLFTHLNYNDAQEICLEALDDDELAEAWLELVPGEVILHGLSEDIRYQDIEEDGELDPTEVDFNVRDNDCGARGYDALDLNEDCVIDLSEVATLYSQWLLCTLPYDAGDECDKSWNLVE